MIASIISFFVSNQAVCAGLGVAVLDMAFALVPSIKANGLLHWLYLALVSQKVPPSA